MADDRSPVDPASSPTVVEAPRKRRDDAEAGEHTLPAAPPASSSAVFDPNAAVDPDAFPVPGWDRYEPIRLLGQGGMGRVFLAKDLRLGREVALKFVRGDDPEIARRTLAEARAQARINDERVCKVFEVGEVRGRVYIAMQYIAGRSLSDLGKELSYEEMAIVMQKAALGVAEAHRVGLIHRDLKPSNIMVEDGPDGELRPYVMDFGVARDWADGTTMTGTVMGTPHYMAPEQARGEVTQLDRRADVYSLGATLYSLLARRPPIEGDNPLVVLVRVCTDEPPRPRTIDRYVPADLEAITMKCLEKDRTARYDSARALADDLGRFLAGEPVAARASAGVGYRLRKWIRRRARLVAGVTVAVVLVAVALGYALFERRRAAQQAALARRFTERVERIESMARYAALAPAHDLRPDRARLRVAMDGLAAEVRDGGGLAEGPGRYALGRGHLALGDDEQAAADLAAAWEAGFREPRVAYELAIAEGRRYRRALAEVERLPKDLPAELRAQRRREVEERYREPALRYLRASGGAEVPSAAYVAALIAFYEGRYDDALARLEEIDHAGDARPWFYEAPLLRGEVLYARALARDERSAALTAADLEASRRALDAAAAIGESAPVVHADRAELELTALWTALQGDGAVAAPFERGMAAAERLLTLLPDDADALALRARLRRGMAEHRDRRGEDVTELLTQAAADAQRAVALAPGRREGRLALAAIYIAWAEAQKNRSQDPGDQLRRASEILGAIPQSERDAEFHVRLGLTYAIWADYQREGDRERATNRRRAIDAYAQAVRMDDRFAIAWLGLGINYLRRASDPSNKDVDGDLAQAITALGRAGALNPTHSMVHFYEGDAYSLAAKRKEKAGGDPAPDRSRAIARYRRGAALSPRSADFPNAISFELLRQAQADQDQGRDPRPSLDEAAAAARQAITVAPDQGYGYINLGSAQVRRATYQQSVHGDPMPDVIAAEATLREATARMPDRPSIWLNLANLHILVAGLDLEAGRDPQGRLAAADTAVERMIALNPNHPLADELRGQIRDLRARSGGGARRGPTPRR